MVTSRIDPVTSAAPTEEASATYSAVVEPIVQDPILPPPRFTRPQACDSYGVSFATPPLSETITLAGHAKLVMWVSSSTDDMDIHASLRVYDESGEQLVYPTDDHGIDAPQKPPIQVGRLKVSQRKLDSEKSSHFQPVHTHLESDSQKLTPGEIVQVEVGFWPLTAEIREGQPHRGGRATLSWMRPCLATRIQRIQYRHEYDSQRDPSIYPIFSFPSSPTSKVVQTVHGHLPLISLLIERHRCCISCSSSSAARRDAFDQRSEAVAQHMIATYMP